MKTTIIALCFALFGCSCAESDYVLSTDELEDRLATAVCERRVRCTSVAFDACWVDQEKLFADYAREGWPAATMDSQMRGCESFIAAAACGQSVWLAEECDFGQGH